MSNHIMAFNYHIELAGEHELVRFNGHINEDAEVALGALKLKMGKSCIFNLRDIKSVNSCGVRAWINFMREAEKKASVIFEECPPEIVGQMNMIPNFRGKAKVNSVYAGYVCENCNRHEMILFKHGENLPQSSTQSLPPVPCPDCQTKMEMEEIEEEYFGWVGP